MRTPKRRSGTLYVRSSRSASRRKSSCGYQCAPLKAAERARACDAFRACQRSRGRPSHHVRALGRTACAEAASVIAI